MHETPAMHATSIRTVSVADYQHGVKFVMLLYTTAHLSANQHILANKQDCLTGAQCKQVAVLFQLYCHLIHDM